MTSRSSSVNEDDFISSYVLVRIPEMASYCAQAFSLDRLDFVRQSDIILPVSQCGMMIEPSSIYCFWFQNLLFIWDS